MTKRILRVPDQLEWMNNALPGRIQMHVSGTDRIMIENYLCVQTFTCSSIVLRSSCGLITVEGSCLSLSQMRPGALIIRGSIASIRMPEDGDRA